MGNYTCAICGELHDMSSPATAKECGWVPNPRFVRNYTFVKENYNGGLGGKNLPNKDSIMRRFFTNYDLVYKCEVSGCNVIYKTTYIRSTTSYRYSSTYSPYLEHQHSKSDNELLGECDPILKLYSMHDSDTGRVITHDESFFSETKRKALMAPDIPRKVVSAAARQKAPSKKKAKKMAGSIPANGSKAIINPNRNKLEKVGEIYAATPDTYRVVTAAYGAGAMFSLWFNIMCVQGSWFFSILFLPVLFPVFVWLAFTAAKRLYFWQVGDKVSIDKSDFFTSYLVNTFNDLLEVKNQYHMNIAAVPMHLRHNVELDEESLNKRLWEIACHLMDMQRFYQPKKKEGELSISLTNRTSDVIGNTIADIKQEITKLQEAVQNCSDIAVLSVSDNIRSDYLDPTIADSLRSISSHRLGGRLELTSGLEMPEVSSVVEVEPVSPPRKMSVD